MWWEILWLVLVLTSDKSISANCSLGEFMDIGEKLVLLLMVVVVEIGGWATSATHASAMRRCSACSTCGHTDTASEIHITLESVALTTGIVSLIGIKS